MADDGSERQPLLQNNSDRDALGNPPAYGAGTGNVFTGICYL